MTDLNPTQTNHMLAKIAHDIQSRIMRIRSLTYTLNKLQKKELTDQVVKEMNERNDRLESTIVELSAVAKLQSLLLELMISETASPELLDEVQQIAAEWATYDSDTDDFKAWIASLLKHCNE